MKRFIANLFFALFINIFKRIKCSFNVSMSHNVFFYLIKSKLKDVNLRDALLGTGVSLNDGVTFFNKPEVFGNVVIGKYTSISGPSTRICAEVNQVIIGSFCSIASNVVIQEFYHNYDLATTYNMQAHFFRSHESDLISKGSIIIEDDVWIGSNSVILSGVKIGRGAIIGAGSVVTKDVEPYTIVAGNPAKKIRERFSSESIGELESSKWWEWDKKEILKNEAFFNKKFSND